MSRKLSEYSNCGKMMLLIGLLISIPLIMLIFYPQDIEYTPCFALPSIFSMLLGIFVCKITSSDSKSIDLDEDNGSLTVLFIWLWGITMGAVPFILGHQLPPVKAFFESVSGWTTTGLTVLSDVSNTPKIFLFHRGFMQFCGGLGFVLVMTLFISGKQSMNLFNAEGHPDKLMPNLKKTAQTIGLIYCGFLAAGTIAYRLTGIPLFDAVNHTMSALSTGGFSTRSGSIGEFNNNAADIVSIVLMIIGMSNFGVLLLLVEGKLKRIFRVSEVRFMFALFIICIPIVIVSLMKRTGIGFAAALKNAVFAIATINSTTGLSISDYSQWPQVCMGVFIILMFIGGSVGSTAGGLKLSRVYLMLRFVWISTKKKLMPSSVVEIPYYYKSSGKTQIDDFIIFDTVGFVVAYICVLFVMALCITGSADCDFIEGIFEVASCMSGTGISIGITNSMTANSTLILEMICMVLGRLEIFIVIVGIYSAVRSIEKSIRRKLR